MTAMTFDEIRKDIINKKYKPIYFLCGEEPFFIDRLTTLVETTVLSEEEKAFNQTIKSIVPLHDNYGLTGIAFSLDDDTILSIYDAGDVIAAKYV